MKLAPKIFTRYGSTFFALYCAQFVTALSFSIALPIIPFIALSQGAAPESVAYIMGSNAIVFLIFSAFLGYLSDKLGRAPIIIFAYLVSSISFYILGSGDSLETLLIARAMGGMHAAAGGVLMAYINDNVEEDHSAAAMGVIGSAITAGFIIGPILITIFNIEDAIDGAKALQFAGLISLVALIIVTASFFFSRKRKRQETDLIKESKPDLKNNFRAFFALSPFIYGMLFIATAVWCIYTGRSSTLALSINATGVANIKQVGLYYATASIVTLFVEIYLVALISKKRWHKRVITWAVVFLILLAISTSILNSVLLLVFYFVVLTAVAALVYPLVMDGIAKSSSASNKGTLMGLGSNCIMFGQTIGPFLAGLSFYSIGVTNLGFTDAAILTVPILFFLVWLKIKNETIS